MEKYIKVIKELLVICHMASTEQKQLAIVSRSILSPVIVSRFDPES